jgi:hypothetical protein
VLLQYFRAAISNPDICTSNKAYLYLGIYHYLCQSSEEDVNESIQHLEKAFNDKNKAIKNEAALYLMRCYLFHQAQHDMKQADIYLNQLKQCDIKYTAFFYYGLYYYLVYFDVDVAKNPLLFDKSAARISAIDYLDKAALSKDEWIRDRANYYIAKCYYASPKKDLDSYKKAFARFEKTATSQDAWVRDRASYYLGLCCYNARGVDKNVTKAFICFKIASISRTASIKEEADRYIEIIDSNRKHESKKDVLNAQQCIVL